MLDMGGAPSAANDQSLVRTVNASKNSKLQAVAFDFQVLTRSIDETKEDAGKRQDSGAVSDNTENDLAHSSRVQPDLNQIQQVASLLKVSVDTGKKEQVPSKPPKKQEPLPKTQPHEDIRAKYAAKLKGGLAGIELAKSQIDDTLKGGDASGHLAARKIAMETAVSGKKWMALTGTGKILSYLTHRSIRIALLPHPQLQDPVRIQDQITSPSAPSISCHSR